MTVFTNPPEELWDGLCRRPSSCNADVRCRVESIIERVRTGGDAALRELSLEIDRRPLESMEVSEEEISEAVEYVSDEVKAAVKSAYRNISKFHSAQMPDEIDLETSSGVRCIQRPVPIERIGLYIPGGTAPLFSTVLMLAIPAAIAGCGTVILCTPSGKDGKVSPEVLYAASLCGVHKIFKIGGAQAVAAMAYGTESIPKVDKIFGPGNQYVTTAKQILGGSVVAIDMPAGPSEVMVIADADSRADYVAADLLSQAEHGNDSQVMLLCNDASFADKVMNEVSVQTESLSRKGFVENALVNSRAVVFDSVDDIVRFANRYAPEHLIVSTREPWSIVNGITAAGSVFVGDYTPESAGDYASGTNHTLPTSAWARAYSGVNIDAYMRKMTIQEISREGLTGLAPVIISMAEAEGLEAHANAVKIRINGKK